MIAEGTYKARGITAALGVASTGNEQVGVELELLEGPDEGARTTWFGSFTEKALDRTLESLRLLGWQGDDLFDLSGIGSTEVAAVIEHEPDQQGELRARVRWINSPGGISMKTRMDEAAARAFSARMRGSVMAFNAKKGTPQPRAAANGGGRPGPSQAQVRARDMAPATPAPDDDQIPF